MNSKISARGLGMSIAGFMALMLLCVNFANARIPAEERLFQVATILPWHVHQLVKVLSSAVQIALSRPHCRVYEPMLSRVDAEFVANVSCRGSKRIEHVIFVDSLRLCARKRFAT